VYTSDSIIVWPFRGTVVVGCYWLEFGLGNKHVGAVRSSVVSSRVFWQQLMHVLIEHLSRRNNTTSLPIYIKYLGWLARHTSYGIKIGGFTWAFCILLLSDIGCQLIVEFYVRAQGYPVLVVVKITYQTTLHLMTARDVKIECLALRTLLALQRIIVEDVGK
jgi:hypothetical protein